MTNFIQDGDSIDYTNGGSAISSGAVVVIGKLIGVAATDIATSETGTVCLDGVYSIAKHVGTAITQGDQLFWDAAEEEVTKTATDKPIGTAHASALSADTTVPVKLNASGDDVPQAAVVTYSAGSNLVGVDGTGSNAAPLAGTETRLDALDTAVASILTALKNAGLMASA